MRGGKDTRGSERRREWERQWVVRKRQEVIRVAAVGQGYIERGFPVINKQGEGVYQREQRQEGVGIHLAPHSPPYISAPIKTMETSPSAVPNTSVISFTVPICVVIKWCEGGDAGHGGGNIPTRTTPLMTPSLWDTFLIAFVVFIAVRPSCCGWL